jgi:DNA-binding response OmpR family regulator
MRILLVEDEPRAAHMLAQGLREAAYTVDAVADASRLA